MPAPLGWGRILRPPTPNHALEAHPTVLQSPDPPLMAAEVLTVL